MTANSGFAISKEVIEKIKEFVPAGSTILEFGSGQGTFNLIAEGYKMLSVEQDKRFVGRCPEAIYAYAPLDKNGWYDHNAVSQLANNNKYDAVLIDGPAAGDRFCVLSLDVDLTKTIIIDDIDRPKDRELFNILSKMEGRTSHDYNTFGVIE